MDRREKEGEKRIGNGRKYKEGKKDQYKHTYCVITKKKDVRFKGKSLSMNIQTYNKRRVLDIN